MQLQDLKELFEIHLGPVKEDIKELKDGQKEMIEIMRTQTKHSIEIEFLQKGMNTCKTEVDRIKDQKSNRLWEVIRMGLAGVFGGIITKIFS